MSKPEIRDFHAHVYFDPAEVERPHALAANASELFGLSVGHFHEKPVGPHPRGSVQMTVPTELFGQVATLLALNRGA